jgi:ribosomal protein S18 acetylase RimI-like enzyme
MLTQPFPAHLFTPPQGFPPDLNFRIVDGSDLRPLHTTCFPDKPFTQFHAHFEKMMGWQKNGRCCWLAACDEVGQIVGSGQLVVYPHGSELANLFVVPARRNEGIGTAMIEVLTAVARHLNLTSLEIGVSVNNGRALRLYQDLGFTVDRQVNLPCQEPVLILYRSL